jgi:hypothetical protein
MEIRPAGKSGKADASHIPRDRVIVHHIGGQKVRRLRRQSEKTLGVAPLYQPQRESAVEGAL